MTRLPALAGLSAAGLLLASCQGAPTVVVTPPATTVVVTATTPQTAATTVRSTSAATTDGSASLRPSGSSPLRLEHLPTAEDLSLEQGRSLAGWTRAPYAGGQLDCQVTVADALPAFVGSAKKTQVGGLGANLAAYQLPDEAAAAALERRIPAMSCKGDFAGYTPLPIEGGAATVTALVSPPPQGAGDPNLTYVALIRSGSRAEVLTVNAAAADRSAVVAAIARAAQRFATP